MRPKDLIELLWKSHRKSIVALAVLLVLNLLLYVAVDQLLVPRVSEQEGRFLQRQNEVRKLLHNQGNAAKSPEQYYVLGSQDLAKFEQAIPEYREFTGLIEELLVLSSRARLEIAQIAYSSEALKELPLLKFDLNFSVVGNYAQIKRFIHSLEQSVRLITIKQINLQRADEETVSLRLSLETFFRKGSREP
jgi:type IV pilus assembly protein PilO